VQCGPLPRILVGREGAGTVTGTGLRADVRLRVSTAVCVVLARPLAYTTAPFGRLCESGIAGPGLGPGGATGAQRAQHGCG
jgi:hypothetical protein